jgi:hypothetical protein
MLRCASASPFPIEARLSMQPFALRRRGPILRLVPVTGSTLLAYIFETIREPTLQPVQLQAPVPVRPFYCLARDDPRLKPVAGVKLPDSPPVFEPPLPSRTFLSFGIKAPNPTPFRNACPYESPDLPSLPVSRKCLTITARRINVPDPLLPVRLTVPRTSWNQVHHAPGARTGSI